MYIDKKEVLRYLGHKNQEIDESLNNLIDELIEEVKEYIQPKYTFRIYQIEKRDNVIKLANSNYIFEGGDINRHLAQSNQCSILATTLGSMIENKIKYYQKVNLTKALILDSCATCAIENYTDDIQEKIKEKANELDLGITYRYSPGYGDFPINTQKIIIRLLEADKKIGLTVTESNILLPRKSVTAIIGFQDKKIISVHPGCNTCKNKDICKFAKEGSYCGR